MLPVAFKLYIVLSCTFRMKFLPQLLIARAGTHTQLKCLPPVKIMAAKLNFLATLTVTTGAAFVSHFSCSLSAAFVILNADTRLRDLLLYEDEYLAELKRLNIDVNTLVDVPIKRNRYDDPWT